MMDAYWFISCVYVCVPGVPGGVALKMIGGEKWAVTPPLLCVPLGSLLCHPLRCSAKCVLECIH